MTKDETARVVESKLGRCMPCLVWAMKGNMPMAHVVVGVDYDHSKSGNIRRGHAQGYGNCCWHHRRVPGEGWTHAQMTAHFGPSLLDGSKRFAETYGTDDYLIQLQTKQLEAA